VDCVRDRKAHQLVPRRVEIDLVDAVSETIVSAQARRVLVRLETERQHLLRRRGPRKSADLVSGPGSALAPQRLFEHLVARQRIVVLQRRRLVQHAVTRHGATVPRVTKPCGFAPAGGSSAT